MAASHILLAAVLLLVLCTLPSQAALDESPYRASSTVKLYHKYTLELNFAYFQKVLMNCSLPVAIVGIICFFVIAIWTCCRCCCKKCRVSEENLSHRFRIFVVIIIVCITLACVGMLIYGFKADEKQSSAMNKIPELVDNVVIWKNQSVDALKNLINITNITINEVNQLLNSGLCGSSINCADANNIVTKCNDINTAANQIITNLGSLELQKIKSQVADNVTFVDDYRHLGMVILLAVLFTTICLQAIIALMDSRCPTKYQVREYCIGKCFTVLLTLIIIILIFFIWFLAAILLFTSVVFADFCIAPANNIIRVASITDQYTVYFLTCDQDPNMISPLATQLSNIDSARNLTRQAIGSLNVTATTSCTGTVSECATVRTLVNNIGQKTESLFTAVGVPDSTGNANSGILKQFSCTSLNGKIQAVFHLVCDDFFLSIAQTFEVLIAFACLFVILQVFVGLSADRMDDGTSSVRPSMYKEDSGMEMKPPAYGNEERGHVMYGGNAQNI